MQWTLDQGTLVPTDEERWRYEEEFLEERERQRERDESDCPF